MKEDEKPCARVALLVVTFNSRKYFARLSKTISEQTEQGFRLVVWDNGSRAEERPHAEDFPSGAIIVQSEENLGFAAANNRAAELINSEFVVLLNPDAFPEPGWLAALISAANHWPKVGAFGSTQLMDDEPERFDGLGDCYHATGLPWRGGYGWSRCALNKEGFETFSPCAAAALYRREAWREASGFDETFFAYCEDVDLGFRLRLAGWSIRQAPQAVVRHVGGGTTGKRSDFTIFYGTRNRLWTFVKCMPSALLLILMPAHLVMTLVFLFITPFRGTGRATWKGFREALLGIGPIITARRNVQKSRRASTLSIAAALTWNPFAVLRRSPPIRFDHGAV